MYVLLTHTPCFVHRSMCDADLLDEYGLAIEALATGEQEIFNELPADMRGVYLPILLGLLDFDPKKRMSVEEAASMLDVA